MPQIAPIALAIVLTVASFPLASGALGASRAGSDASTLTEPPSLACPSERTGSGWYEANPVYTDSRDDSADWDPVTPASAGLDEATLDAGTARYRKSAVQSILVLRDGELAYERYLNGATAASANNLHSASKTLIGLLLGIAVDKGLLASLDTTLAEVMPERFTGPADPRGAITIRQLATMSSGLRWTEDVSEYKIARKTTDWVGGILDLGMATTPGTGFHYSTGNTHLLSAVIAKVAGMSTCAFARLQLLDPMGISVEHWGRDPSGVNSGGYNVYLTGRELAKLGLLISNGGTWKGTPLVSEAMVAALSTRSFRTDRQFGYANTYDYGLLTWLQAVDGHPISFAWGWGGQYIVQIPDERIVLVVTQRTTDGTGGVELDLTTYLQRYLFPALRDAAPAQPQSAPASSASRGR